MKKQKLFRAIGFIRFIPSLLTVLMLIFLLFAPVSPRDEYEKIIRSGDSPGSQKQLVLESEQARQKPETEARGPLSDQSRDWRLNELLDRSVREYGEGDFKLAEATLNEALSLDLGNPHILAMLIQINSEQGHDSNLVELYPRLLAVQPENSLAYTALGMLLVEQGRTKEAEDSFLKAELLGTEEPYPYFFLARAARERQLSGESTSPERIISRLHLAMGKSIRKMAAIQIKAAGTIQQKQGSLESEDLKELEELSALSVQPRRILQDSIVLLRECYQDDNEFEQDLRRLADWYPHTLELCNALGSLLEEQQRFEEAYDYWYGIINNFPTAADVHMGLARCLDGLDKPRQAMTAYRRARDLAPENSDIYRALNRLYIADGQEETLLQWYGEIYERERTNISLLYGWADLEEKAGLWERAEKHRLRAEELKRRG